MDHRQTSPDTQTAYLARTLTQDEQKLIRILRSHPQPMRLDDLREEAGLEPAPFGRAVQWLEEKKLITRETKQVTHLKRTEKGTTAFQEGLPEERLARLLEEKGSLSMREARDTLREGFNIALGTLKHAGSIRIDKGILTLVQPYASPLQDVLQEEVLPEDHPQQDELLKRGLYTRETISEKYVRLTRLGERIPLPGRLEDHLTPDMIRTGAYKRKTFRAYHISQHVPPAEGGSLHFTTRIIQHIRQVWLSLGFEEVTGSIIQTAFWNFDALFTPQDHPAREMQDTFFLHKPTHGHLPGGRTVKRVRDVHVHGGSTGSRGWEDAWSRREARRLVLRTHTTVLSAQALSCLREDDLPLKIFSIGPVFRNETLDWKHLFEFHQVEGIVAAPRLTFTQLKGYLTAFFKRLGYERIRLRPAYFPYTEPSVEVDVHVPDRGWMELGGAGIFRPEVVKPLTGRKLTVLAWGLGLARIIMQSYQFKDIRDIQSRRLSLIRSLPDPDPLAYAQRDRA